MANGNEPLDDKQPESSGESGDSAESAPPEPSPAQILTERVCALDPQCLPYSGNCDCAAVEIPAERLVALMEKLFDPENLDFSALCNHTGIDRIEKERFELIYHLYSLSRRTMVMVSVSVPRDNPVIPTVCKIWKTAEFQEREVYDLMGVLYDNHPDLRRVFLEDEWEGFPLRKDYKDDFMLTLDRDY